MIERVKNTGGPVTGLLGLRNYCAITFPNTHNALQAEKILKEKADFRFVVMPVPRMISSGCGLAIKTYNEGSGQVVTCLQDAGISIDGVYSIDNDTGSVERII